MKLIPKISIAKSQFLDDEHISGMVSTPRGKTPSLQRKKNMDFKNAVFMVGGLIAGVYMLNKYSKKFEPKTETKTEENDEFKG